MEKLKSYEDLLVYQKADVLALEVYLVANSFPKSELYGLIFQLKRAVLSVPANIVEGFTRKGTKEFIQFLYISLASLAESEYYIKFALKLKYIDGEKADGLLEKSTEVGK
ncbi:four helix bundle protein, partial [bacterium (Candidatus Howlettbacteria) CG_4_10_14_0_8_um_filter_40_9]